MERWYAGLHIHSTPVPIHLSGCASVAPSQEARTASNLRTGRQEPASNPSPGHLSESPDSLAHSSGAPTLQKGHSVFAKKASQWAGGKAHLGNPRKKSSTLPGPYSVPQGLGRKRVGRLLPKEDLNWEDREAGSPLSRSISTKASPPAQVSYPCLPGQPQKGDLHGAYTSVTQSLALPRTSEHTPFPLPLHRSVPNSPPPIPSNSVHWQGLKVE